MQSLECRIVTPLKSALDILNSALKKRDEKAELNRCSQAVKSWLTPVFASREMDEHQGSAPCIPVWKTGVYLSTPMLEERESRAGIAPAFAPLQDADPARP